MTLQQRIYKVARAFEGANEFIGNFSNPFIVKMIKWALPLASGARIDKKYSWCGIFQAWVLKCIGKEHLAPDRFWVARNWLKVGEEVPLSKAKEGDYVVFWRGSKDSWQGHVSQLTESGIQQVYTPVYGANQGNEVRVSNYMTSRILGVRRLQGDDVSIKFKGRSFLTKIMMKYL